MKLTCADNDCVEQQNIQVSIMSRPINSELVRNARLKSWISEPSRIAGCWVYVGLQIRALRVVIGGTWYDNVGYCRVSFRIIDCYR